MMICKNVSTIKKIINELNIYAYEYYVLDNPSISDKEYDKKYSELEKLEAETKYIDKNSPTQRIGDITLSKFEKVKHRTHLWSLDKAQTKEEVKEFISRCWRFVVEYNAGHNDKLPKPQFIITKKFDGLTLNSSFKNGLLEKSASRGTGEEGELLTEQSKTIINLPKSIDYKGNIDVHGEALMTKNGFKEYNNNLKVGEEPLKNLRNGAAGALRNLNIKETARRKLITEFYDLSYSEEQFETYIDTLEFMKEQGFTVAEYEICNNFDEVNKVIDDIGEIRSSLQYDIDGVVIRVNDLKTSELMGYTIKFPKYGIAYKFEAEETTTTLLNVEWNVGRSGKVTPRGKVEPVQLMGATVQYATLNNIDDIRRKNVKLGGRIFIRRSNDVIPEIMGNADNEGKEILPPTICPSCGSKLIQDGVHYFCENTLGCKPQLIKNIVHFAERKAMNIEGISIKTIEQLMDANIINTIVDLYRLKNKRQEILKLDRFGEKKYLNLVEAIEKSKKCTLSSLVYALGIEGVGQKTSKDITKVFDSIDKLYNVTIGDLLKVEDIGGISARNIYNWFHSEDNRKLLDTLLIYVSIDEEKRVEVQEGIFKGQKIYCTGTFANYKKEQLKSIVERLGGEFANGYAKSLSMLVVGSIKGSSKTIKAENDGVKIIYEDEFIEMIGGK
jgi:DNA ligase (NAD+)